MALRGAVPLGSPRQRPRALSLVRSRTQPWRFVNLAWGEHTLRSLLLYAVVIAGSFAGFALPSMLSQPPDHSTVLSLRIMSFVLFGIGIVIAPTRHMNRAMASFALTMHIISTLARTVMVSGDLRQPPTYGEVDAYRFIGVATLLLYWMVLRMRHPLSLSVATGLYTVVCGMFFVFGSNAVRDFVASTGMDERRTSLDETLIWTAVGAITLLTLAFSVWVDAYCRAFLPLRGYEYRAIRTPVVRDDRGSVLKDYRLAWLFFWLLLDVPAIIFAVRALLRPLGLEGDREWYARVLLPLATARLTMAIVALGAVTIALLNPEYRSVG